MLLNSLVVLGVFTSQFYIFSSGVPQLSHMILVLAFGLVFFKQFFLNANGVEKNSFTNSLFLFVYFSTILNLYFCIVHEDTEYLVSSVYTVYGLTMFLLFSFWLSTSRSSEKWLMFSSIASVTTLFVLCILEIGRFNFHPRFNAFFNDPNQMAYWALCVFAIIACSSQVRDSIKNLVFLMVLLIIFKSFSRSGLLGLAVMSMGMILSSLLVEGNRLDFKKTVIGLIAIVLLLGAAGAYLIQKSDDLSFYTERAGEADVAEQMDVRGYTKILKYPEYIIIGAGQGGNERFLTQNLQRSTEEIHSTWAGLLFYYGIWGLGLWMVMHIFILRKLPIAYKLIFLGPVFYAFSTYGLRTPVFWMYLSYFYYFAVSTTKQESY